MRLKYRALHWLFSRNSDFPQNAPAYRAQFWNFCPIIHCVFYTKSSQKVNFFSNCAYNIGHFIDFSPKKVIFSWKCACISSTILTFCLIIQCVFKPKIPKKLIFPQISTIIQGTLLTFIPKKLFLPQNAPAYRALFLLLPNNPVCFYNKNSQNFSSNCEYNTGHFIDFSPEKSDLSSKCACILSTILTFLPNDTLCFYTKKSPKS